MDQRFGRRAASADRRAALVDLDDFVRAKVPLERRAWRDGYLQRLVGEDGAEIAAGAEHPAASVKALAHVDELLCDVRKALRFHERVAGAVARREKPSLYSLRAPAS